MKRILASAIALAIVLVAASARAEENPNGTWKWDVTFNNQTFNLALKLKQDGEKLTGTLTGPAGDTEIQDGKYKDGELSFTIIRERNGQKMTFKYNGKVSGDTIKGKTTIDRDGQTTDRDWEAKRSKD
ncbi:MAG TPA: hypothetical protein VGH32_03135 [Pirellulales bacterium]